MRIAVWHNSPSGGGKRALWQQVTGLSRRGHQLEVWSPASVDRTFLPLQDCCPEHFVPLDSGTDGSPSRLFGWLQEVFIVKRRLRAMEDHCRACARQIGQGRFDLLFANTCNWFATSPIGRHVDLPRLLYLQQPYRNFHEVRPGFPWPARPVREPNRSRLRSQVGLITDAVWLHSLRIQVREEINFAKAFDRILVNSLFSREYVLRSYGLESQVCRLGVDTDFFRPTGEPIENYLVGLGAIVHSKGVDRALRAVAAMAPAARPKLVWIGNAADSAYAHELRQQSSVSGVGFEIRVLVDDRELISLLSRATAMICTPRLEPFGLAALEANACGLPVVAIAEGGLRESIVHGQNGLLVPGDDPQQLAAALSSLRDNPAQAGHLRAQARAMVVSHWSLDAAVGRLEQALMDLVSSKTTRPALGSGSNG
jgi:glycosyltransferase involved in cell wall biosynthesis